MCTTENKIHAFEKAGLGLAPFRYLGSSIRVGPIRLKSSDGVEFTSGSPGQPMGCCAYCGTGIAECCEILSADGKRFIVGNECVKKTGDAGMIDLVQREHNRIVKAKRHEKEAETIQWLRDLLNTDGVWKQLEAMPHPNGFEGKTAADWVEWMVHNSGNAGKIRVAKFIKNSTIVA